MNDAQTAAKALAEAFVPIDNGHPRVQEFEQSVLDEIATRPAPRPEPEVLPGGFVPWRERFQARLDDVDAKLDQIIELLNGGPR